MTKQTALWALEHLEWTYELALKSVSGIKLRPEQYAVLVGHVEAMKAIFKDLDGIR